MVGQHSFRAKPSIAVLQWGHRRVFYLQLGLELQQLLRQRLDHLGLGRQPLNLRSMDTLFFFYRIRLDRAGMHTASTRPRQCTQYCVLTRWC